ncbi:hypothetical protein IJX73_03865 [bacterium]|nr:hypothetical protein [bacterium]MBQ9150048.1 hypothetical protein [bacterium]
MNILNASNFTNISFAKKLVAKCHIGDKENSCEANIYHLDRESDYLLFRKIKDTRNWDNSFYFLTIMNEFCSDYNKSQYYVMEDEKGDAICFSKTSKTKKKTDLEYIETMPKISTNNPRRIMKYVGETMLAFLVLVSDSENKVLNVPNVANREKTKKFYFEQCGFKKNGKHAAYMPKDRTHEFAEQNKCHTGSKIEIIV